MKTTFILKETMKPFNGKITISRTASNVESEYISVEIKDADSKRRIKVKLSLKDYALAVTGVSFIPCAGETNFDEEE